VNDGNSRLVYSTDGGRVAPPRVAKPVPARGSSPAPSIPDDGIVRLHRDRKGRGGKTGTMITGLPGGDADLDALLKRLKGALGTGGTREGRSLFIQGDHRERLRSELERLGHTVKLAGG
jgi:translation initiation factor 1